MMKVMSLEGRPLDWAVHVALDNFWSDNGYFVYKDSSGPYGQYTSQCPPYSTDWALAGPIIHDNKLELRPGLCNSQLWACWAQTRYGLRNIQGKTGLTPLIAAMRCFVASKLGEDIDIPEKVMI